MGLDEPHLVAQQIPFCLLALPCCTETEGYPANKTSSGETRKEEKK